MSTVVTVIEKCPVCGKTSRRRMQRGFHLPPQYCSDACVREHYWRTFLETLGKNYYPNPLTHDKLGRKLGG